MAGGRGQGAAGGRRHSGAAGQRPAGRGRETRPRAPQAPVTGRRRPPPAPTEPALAEEQPDEGGLTRSAGRVVAEPGWMRPPLADRRQATSGSAELDERGREWLYGRQAVREALRGQRAVFRLWLAEGARRSGIIGEILQLAGRRGLRAEERPVDELSKLGGGVNHQGVLLLAAPYLYADLSQIMTRLSPEAPQAVQHPGEPTPTIERPLPPLVLVLDSLQDPQNFGSLLRSAEAAGVTAVLIPEHRQVGVTPAVVNASAGAVEHLAVARVTNLSRTLERLKEHGCWVAGLEQAEQAQLAWMADLTGALALVVGGEGEGMSRLVREHCDFLIQVPMAGRIESLNAAVAGSIVLFEIVRQRMGQSARVSANTPTDRPSG